MSDDLLQLVPEATKKPKRDPEHRCARCGQRYFVGVNKDPVALCGICLPRFSGVDWARIPNLQRLDLLEEPVEGEA